MPDEKLVAAMEEIKPILKRYDVAALILLSSPTHLEFLREYETTWSCMKMQADEEGIFIQVKSKREHFPTVEAQKKCVLETIGFMATMADSLNIELGLLNSLLTKISKHIEFANVSIEEGPTGSKGRVHEPPKETGEDEQQKKE